MFDLDSEIQKFLKTFNNKSIISKPCLDEIEDHIRLEVENFLGSGLSPQQSLDRACYAFGQSTHLIEEYRKMQSSSRLERTRNYLSHFFNRRIMMRLIFGLFFGMFFMLSGLLLEGGQIASITQVTGLIIVVGGAFGALLIAYPMATIKRSLVLAFTGRNATRPVYLEAASVFRSFGDLSLLTGFIGFVFGLIHVLEHMEKYPTQTGVGLAVSVTAILYALIIKLFIGRALYESFLLRARSLVKASAPQNSGDIAAA